MPGSSVSTRLRVDTFLILSSIKLPLIVGVAMGVAVGVVAGVVVGVAVVFTADVAVSGPPQRLIPFVLNPRKYYDRSSLCPMQLFLKFSHRLHFQYR